MLHVVTNWELGALNANEVLVFSSSTLEQEPINHWIALVLVTLDEIPAMNKMLGDVIDTVTDQPHRDIVPWHPTVFSLAKLISLPFFYTLEVYDSVVVEVLPGKDGGSQIGWMDISQRMLISVPPSEA